VALVVAMGLVLSGFLNRALRQARYGDAITVPVAPSPGYAYLQLAERQGLADARRQALAQILQVRRQLELLGLLPAASPMPAVDDGPLSRALAIR
jgi:hypothetical protein